MVSDKNWGSRNPWQVLSNTGGHFSPRIKGQRLGLALIAEWKKKKPHLVFLQVCWKLEGVGPSRRAGKVGTGILVLNLAWDLTIHNTCWDSMIFSEMKHTVAGLWGTLHAENRPWVTESFSIYYPKGQGRRQKWFLDHENGNIFCIWEYFAVHWTLKFSFLLSRWGN